MKIRHKNFFKQNRILIERAWPVADAGDRAGVGSPSGAFISLNVSRAWMPIFFAAFCLTSNVPAVQGFQEIENRVVTPNFRQAEQYSSAYLRQFVYSTSVTPNWIDKTDEFWYSYKTSLGTQYWRVNPEKNTRLPLFDHYKLASQLSEMTRKPVEPGQLALTRVELKNETDTLTFVAEKKLFEYSLKTEVLTDRGPAPPEPNRSRTGGRMRGQQREEQQREEQQKEEQQREEQQREEQQKEEQQKEEQQKEEQQKDDVTKKDDQQEVKKDGEKIEEVKQEEVKREDGGQRDAGNRSSAASPRGDAHRVFAPDRKSYVFAKGHDLYWVQIPEAEAKTEEAPTKLPGEGEQVKTDESKTSDEQNRQQKKDEQNSDQKAKAVESTESKKSEDNHKTEKSKDDSDSKRNGTKESEESKSDSSEPRDVNTIESIQETDKQEVVKEESVKQDETKKDKKTEGGKQEDGKIEDGKQDETKAIKQDETKGDKQEVTKDEKNVETQDQKKEETQDEKKEETQVDKKEETQDEKKENTQDEKKSGDQSQDESEPAADKKPAAVKFNPKWDELAVRLTKDGAESYSFAGMPTTRGQSREIKEDTLTRPSITWAENSKSFYVNRRDSRGVKDLWVINSLTDPRPSLEQYPYPMPGEENIRKSEMYYFHGDSKSLTRVKPRWKDESYSDVRFNQDHTELRFLRRDRLLRNVELCSLTLATGDIVSLFEEGFEQATIAPKGLRYLKNNQEMIWWSERSGWGHFYLYDADGKLKNPITTGSFVANRIVELDEENRILYFEGLGREPGENLNYAHLYSIRLDGGDLKLLNPGDANHASVLSPTKRYLVDNYSRVDLAPASVLRSFDGQEIMKLEEADLSRLHQVGWQIPETFIVKAADGVTDLFGNMYKPFNFDPNKKYPVITYVYPGPQQEGTRHTFTATAGEQQLAQIGFIVIQVGHRGGTPGRSKAYASYGYFNLRDYALADKKSAIEQLAQRYSFIDVERVGMYGHSGGGFMTAAALMVPPYNDFFKAGFSTAGNHDNNIYNNSWSERWHGLKEVPVEEETASTRQGQSRERTQQRTGPSDLKASLSVDPEDFFYDYEMANDEDQWDLDRRMWGDEEPIPLWLQDQVLELQREQELQDEQQRTQRQEGQNLRDRERQQQRGGRRGQQRRQELENDSQRGNQERRQEENKDQDKVEKENQDVDKENVDDENVEKGKGKETENDGEKQIQEEDVKQEENDEDQKEDQETKEVEKKTRFEIRVPSNAELAANLKHHLFLVHGELDNNVHPANTLRLVDALIKANKRFDMMYLPGTRHGFGQYQPYVTQRMFEFFAERLLSDYQSGADMNRR